MESQGSPPWQHLRQDLQVVQISGHRVLQGEYQPSGEAGACRHDARGDEVQKVMGPMQGFDAAETSAGWVI